VVNRDNTVSVGGRVLQIDRVRWRGHAGGLPGAGVRASGRAGKRVLRPPPGGSVSRGSAQPRGSQKLWKRRFEKTLQKPGLLSAWKSPTNRGIPTFPQVRQRSISQFQPDRSCAYKTGHLDLLTTRVSAHSGKISSIGNSSVESLRKGLERRSPPPRRVSHALSSPRKREPCIRFSLWKKNLEPG